MTYVINTLACLFRAQISAAHLSCWLKLPAVSALGDDGGSGEETTWRACHPKRRPNQLAHKFPTKQRSCNLHLALKSKRSDGRWRSAKRPDV
eukprot:5001663-Amphidinium_carterae.2